MMYGLVVINLSVPTCMINKLPEKLDSECGGVKNQFWEFRGYPVS